MSVGTRPREAGPLGFAPENGDAKAFLGEPVKDRVVNNLQTEASYNPTWSVD